MAKFRKKPVVIEAVQYRGYENLEEVEAFLAPLGEIEWKTSAPPMPMIRTLEGVMRASVGDWIIRGVNGEFYPCKSDIFEKTYEPVED